jgi:hypothetical protein
MCASDITDHTILTLPPDYVGIPRERLEALERLEAAGPEFERQFKEWLDARVDQQVWEGPIPTVNQDNTEIAAYARSLAWGKP